VLITSPETIPSPDSGRAPRSTSASPVLTPIRTWSSSAGSASFSSAIASWMASAARTARSGSSSWETGAPNTATTASPMNFSTVPPNRSSSWRNRSWYGARIARTSSGSSVSARAVEPTMSAKTTVTTFRSSRAAFAVWVRGAPQAAQKRASSSLSLPHREQAIMRGVYGGTARPPAAGRGHRRRAPRSVESTSAGYPASAGASSATKPTRLCDASQNGFVREWPQRQSATALPSGAAISRPSAATMRTGPASLYGPFGRTVIVTVLTA
jgi:hypothetical protein